jgi:hypothetical protein
MPRDLKRVKEYIELGFDKEVAVKMVDEEGATEPVQEPTPEPTKDDSKALSKEDVIKIVEEERQKENLKNTQVDVKEQPTVEGAFKNILGTN